MIKRDEIEIQNAQFVAERPWPFSECQDGLFYHSMSFPDGTSVDGQWDIRGRFEAYIGHYPLIGKTVLDVGTATGFLAFSAERIAAHVTALDARSSREFRRIPFYNSAYHRDRNTWVSHFDREHLRPLKKGFWYSWHKLNSKVEVIYAPLDKLYAWERRFDVILAGAIVEHIADPISAIGVLAGLANEAVIIACTDIVDTDEWVLQPGHDLSNPVLDFEWWKLSRGLYQRIFENLGFTIEIVESKAFYVPAGKELSRFTIIARRKLPIAVALMPPQQHNSARVSDLSTSAQSLDIAVETDDPMGSYAISFALVVSRSFDASGRDWLVIDVQVERGVIGIGCTNSDYTSWLDEVEVVHAGARRKISVSFGTASAPSHLVFCNYSPDGRSQARIHGIELRRATR